MNSSIWFADRITHIKIVVVALVATVVIVGIGIGARTNDWGSTTVTAKVNGPILRAGKQLNMTASESFKVR